MVSQVTKGEANPSEMESFYSQSRNINLHRSDHYESMSQDPRESEHKPPSGSVDASPAPTQRHESMGNVSAPAESYDGNQTFMSFQQKDFQPGESTEEYKMAVDPSSSQHNDSSVLMQDGYLEPLSYQP